METKDKIFKKVVKDIKESGNEYRHNCEDFLLLVAKHAATLGVNMWQGGSGKGHGRAPNMDDDNKCWVLYQAYLANGTVASPKRAVKKVELKKVQVKKVQQLKKAAQKKPVAEEEEALELIDDDEEGATVSEGASGKRRREEESAPARKRPAREDKEENQAKLVEHFKMTIHYANKLGTPVSQEAMRMMQAAIEMPARLS